MGSSHKKQGKIADNNLKKAKIFSKLVRLIQVEAKIANANVDAPGLSSAIAKALKANMPKDNIERAIKKASDVGNTTSVLYEAYGPGGVGLVITGLTDNTNRTSQEIKHILSKNNLSLAAPGSVVWDFEKNQDNQWVGKNSIELDDTTFELLMNLILLLEDNDDIQDVYHNSLLAK